MKNYIQIDQVLKGKTYSTFIKTVKGRILICANDKADAKSFSKKTALELVAKIEGSKIIH